MVLGYTVNHLFQHPVEKVIDAHMKSHEKCQNIVEVKQVEHQQDVDGLEYLKRVITAFNPLPTIVRKIGRMDNSEMQMEEELWIDQPGRRYWLRQHNLSFSENITIQKNSTFVPDSHNQEWTCFEQAGAADMTNLGFVGKALELLYKNMMESEVRQHIALIEGLLDKV